jgi:hypothetical protein
MNVPTFFVIGASRSGTTSLHRYLAQHPDVFVTPAKSPNHFAAGDEQPPWEGPVARTMARQWVADRAEYEAIFAGAAGKRAVGDVSPVYLQTRNAPRRIREACGHPFLVAILRHPVERAYAHYLGRRRDGIERRTSFAEAVRDELSRPLPDDVAFGSYLGSSRYHHFLDVYLQLFPRERMRIFLFEDLERDPGELMRRLFELIGVSTEVPLDTSKQYNRSGTIHGSTRRFLWTRSVQIRTALRPWLPAGLRDLAMAGLGRSLDRPSLEPELRAKLVEVFRDDVGRLEAAIGRDLSAWRA